MAQIVLFFPNPFSSTRDFGGVPLSLLAISRLLTDQGYTIKIVTPHEYSNYEQVVMEESADALCLGISAMAGYQIYDGLKVAESVKRKFPKLPVIWGGWHPSILPEQTASDPRVDIVVRGQGERTFSRLVNALAKGADWGDIPGLTYRRGTGVVSTDDIVPERLDNFPPIPYHLIDVEKYLFPSELGDRNIAYYSSYGCPFRCGFCVEKIVNKRRWVGESAESTVRNLELLVRKYSVDAVCMHDSNFFADPRRATRMAQLLIDKGLSIKWGCANGRSDQLSRYTDDDWALLAGSGCKTVLVGTESGSQSTLDFLNKDITLEQTEKIVRDTGRHKIKIYASFLVGVPRSLNKEECRRLVEKEFSETLSFMDRLMDISRFLRVMFFVYLPYPSSDLFAQAKALGLCLPESLPGWANYLMQAEDARNIGQYQQWMTGKQMLTTLMISSYIFFFLDGDSVEYVRKRVSNRFVRASGLIAFYVFRGICLFRWKLKWFGLPVDFFFYNFLRARLNIG